MSSVVNTPPLPDAPYRGIEPFRFTDQQIFAARTEETWTLLSNVTLYRAVLLYGASGTGKSSLINAGFLPEALKENFVPDRLRVQPIAGEEIKVERIRVSSSGQETAYLPSNFAPTELHASPESIVLSLAAFKDRLETFRPPAEEGKPGSLLPTPGSRPRPLLIFDQFEEFITLFEEAQRPGAAGETPAPEQVRSTQQAILKTLVKLIQDETLPIKIIFAFREDYLARLSLLFEYCPDLVDQSQRLLLPAIEAVPQIIRAPFTDPELRAHFLKQSGTVSEITESLAQKIAAELSRLSEGGKANLTELQIVCQRLWKTPDAEKQFLTDGIEGLLKSYLTNVFRDFTPKLQDVAVVLLSHMITASNTRNIISQDDLESRTAECGFQRSQYAEALQALSDKHIVRRESRRTIYFYEITSEYLVPWIKKRVADRKTIEERRQAEEERRQAEEKRLQAVILDTKERRARLLRRGMTVLIVLLITALALLGLALKQAKRAETAEGLVLEETAKVKAEQDQVELKNVTIDLLNAETEPQREQLIAEAERLIRQRKDSADLKKALIAVASTSQNLKVQNAANRVLKETAHIDPKPIPLQLPHAGPLPSPTVTPKPEANGSNGSLVLRLVDAETDRPLGGANVRLTLRNLSKGKDEFEWTGTELDLEEGAYDVFVNVGGYIQTYRQFRIHANTRTPLTVKLTRRKSVPQQTTPRPEQVIIPVEQQRRRGNPQSTPQ